MGYRDQKAKVTDKIQRIKRIALSFGVFLLVGLLIFSFFYPPNSWKYYFHLPKVGKRQQNEMRVHFLDVGQGDCILIELPDGKVMLVDGGGSGAKTEKTVLRYMNALKIDVIDHLLITHTDNDHSGAIGEVARMKKVLNAYLPTTSNIEGGCYAAAYAELSKKECELFETNRALNLSQDGATPYTLSFLYPYMENLEEENEGSAVFWLDYMGVSFLFTGDASSEVEEVLVRDDEYGFLKEKKVELSSTEILKVAHHGSVNSSSLEFLNYLNLQTAVISCGKDNAYGHPADSVLDKLQIVGSDVYRTDEDGHIIVTVKEDGSYFVERVKS
ncbi:MAG: MBL fold metallo-hydrolase [Clostridia bacterium]|nr:MBL fold metallo-hydrolase [Clostridia bacterium]